MRTLLVGLAVAIGMPTSLTATQSTLLPTFHIPNRNFARNEKGLSVSFPGGATAVEGLYGVASGTLDIRFRGGALFDQGPANETIVLFGTEFRHRVIAHSADFPADGAVIFGAGAWLGNQTVLAIPVGLSLGRRLTLEDSEVAIVPFVQPTGTIIAGDNSDFVFSLGLGADFQLTRAFDLRFSVGLGDIDGVTLGAVWVN